MSTFTVYSTREPELVLSFGDRLTRKNLEDGLKYWDVIDILRDLGFRVTKSDVKDIPEELMAQYNYDD